MKITGIVWLVDYLKDIHWNYVIVKSPKIILADEPTGSLDEVNRDYVLKVLEKFNEEGKTVIIVTHDSCVASYINYNCFYTFV